MKKYFIIISIIALAIFAYYQQRIWLPFLKSQILNESKLIRKDGKSLESFTDGLNQRFIYDYDFSQYFIRYKDTNINLSSEDQDFYDKYVGYTDLNYSYDSPLSFDEVYINFGSLKISEETWGTGYHLGKYADVVYYSSKDNKFWQASGGGTSILSQRDIMLMKLDKPPYRISGPHIDDSLFINVINQKSNDRIKYINQFANIKKDENKMRKVMINTIKALVNKDDTLLLSLLSDKYVIQLKNYWDFDILEKKTELKNDMNNKSANINTLFSKASEELSGSVLGNFSIYVNDFISDDIRDYANKYHGCTIITCTDRYNYPEVKWILNKEKGNYKIVSFTYFLNNGE